VYYVQTPQGYMVTAPPAPGAVMVQPPGGTPAPYIEQPPQAPPPASAGSAPAVNGHVQIFAYPLRGQSPEQQAKDRTECQSWASSQTGLNPTQTPPAGVSSTQTDNYKRAMAACLEARGYTAK